MEKILIKHVKRYHSSAPGPSKAEKKANVDRFLKTQILPNALLDESDHAYVNHSSSDARHLQGLVDNKVLNNGSGFLKTRTLTPRDNNNLVNLINGESTSVIV